MPPEGGEDIQIAPVIVLILIQNFIKATGRPSITGYSSGYAQADFTVDSINITDIQSAVIAGLLACIDSKTCCRSNKLFGYTIGVGNGEEAVTDGYFMVAEFSRVETREVCALPAVHRLNPMTKKE